MSSTEQPNPQGGLAQGSARATFLLSDATRERLEKVARKVADAAVVAESRESRSVLLHEQAEADERLRGDEPAAARAYLAAFNARPAFRAPLDALLRLYTRRRSTQNLSKLFDALVKASSELRDKAEATTRKGELQEDKLDDAAGARASFESAVAVDPSYRPGWMALERVALQTGDKALLIQCLAQLADASRDANRKARLLVELAVEVAQADDPKSLEEASKWLRMAADLPSGRWRALVELERFGERFGRTVDVVDALEGRAMLAQEVAVGGEFHGGSGAFSLTQLAATERAGVEACELWVRASQLRQRALGDAEGAWSAMGHALALRPDDARVHFLAMSLADVLGDLGRAGDHAAWLLAQGFGDAALKASLHFRVAERAALGGDLAAASTALRAALALDPASAAVRAALVEQLVAAGEGLDVVQEFDRIAESGEAGSPETRAGVHRVAAFYALCLRGSVDEALRRFKAAVECDAADVISRRAMAMLLARAGLDGDAARRDPREHASLRLAAIEGLLGHVVEPVEKAALELDRYMLQRYELGDPRGAAASAERLVEATDESVWALERAALAWAAADAPAVAARWAEHLSGLDVASLPGGVNEARAWGAASARWFLAAGDAPRARELAFSAHLSAPDDLYASTLALHLALGARDADQAVQIALRTADTLAGEEATRWLLVAAASLEAEGAVDAQRAVIAQAVARDPGHEAVREAVLLATRWRGDALTRANVAESALSAGEVDDSVLALAVELVLQRAFVDRDADAARELLLRAMGAGGDDAPVVALLAALQAGATLGPDAEETLGALQALLQSLPANDKMRVGIELEVARVLGARSSTRDQAAAARELVDEDRPELAATRLLALLDAISREDRGDVAGALRRVADLADADSAGALRGLALGALRAQGRAADARQLALANRGLASATVALSESAPTLDLAAEHAEALRARIDLAADGGRESVERLAANWLSVGGDDAAALALAKSLVQRHPDDLAAWDVLRVAARRLSKWREVCEACEALGARVKTPSRAAALWEEAGVVALDALRDPSRAERSLRSALEAEATRVVAYKKLREVLEARKDTAGLEAVVSRRAAVVEGNAEKVELYWEQARLRRALGLREGALEGALRVVALDPEHVAARALIVEIHASSGRLDEAAEALAALAACKETPRAQRKVARLGAIDLFEKRLGRPEQAVEQLDALVREGDGDDALIARGLEIARGAQLWEHARRFAVRQTDRIADLPTKARALVSVAEIERDRLRDADAARAHALEAHNIAPADLTVLKLLQGLSFPDDRARHARRTIEALRDRLRSEGPTSGTFLGIAEAAQSGGDSVLERAARRALALVTPGAVAPALATPSGASLRDPQLLLRYRNPNDSGRAVALLEAALPELAELAMMTPDALKLGRSERIKGAHPIRTALGPYLAAGGVTEFELYVGGNDPQRALVLPGDPVAVVLGRGVNVPLDEGARFSLVRSMLLTLRGCAAAIADPVELVVARVMAALAYAELPIAGGTARFEAQLKPVAKALSRKTRRVVAELGRGIAASPEGADEVRRAVVALLSTARRGAFGVSGAVQAAFADLERAEPQGASGASSPTDDGLGRELLLFSVSDALTQLVRETGVDRR